MDPQKLKVLQDDPREFRNALRIDSDWGTVSLAGTLDEWQKADFAAVDPAWCKVVGQTIDCQHRRAWLERPRGHSKTSDLAVQVVWALFAARRKLSGVAAAGDTDQAKLLRDAVEKLVQLNPWLRQFIEVQRLCIRNPHTSSQLDIISSDAATSYGLTPDFVICDELTHWRNRGLWDSLFSAAAKRQNCVVIVITNAGFRGTWQWTLREGVRNDPVWHFNALNGPQASWITADRLEEQRRLLPSILYDRLWLNCWSSGSGNALEEGDITKAISLAGPASGREPGLQYFAGLDMGIKWDATGFVVLGRHTGYVESPPAPRTNRQFSDSVKAVAKVFESLGTFKYQKCESTEAQTGRIRLAQVHTWLPSSGRNVRFEDVERTILAAHERFRFSAVFADPHQAAQLMERLRNRGVPIQEATFTGPNLQKMATITLEAFREGRIALYREPALLSDLRALEIVEKSYGFRLESPRRSNSEGTRHGDTATALMLALLAAKTFAWRPTPRIEGPLVWWTPVER